MDCVATMGMTRHCRVRANAFSSPLGSSSPTLAKAWYSSQIKTGRPDEAVGLGLHPRRPTEQRLEPRIFQHDADRRGPAPGLVPAGMLRASTLPPSISAIEGRQIDAFHGGRRERARVGARGASLSAGRGSAGSWNRRASGAGRAEHARHGRQVEHAEEHGHAFHDARPDLVVEGVPVVDVPAIDGFERGAGSPSSRSYSVKPLTVVLLDLAVCVRYVSTAGCKGARARPSTAECKWKPKALQVGPVRGPVLRRRR